MAQIVVIEDMQQLMIDTVELLQFAGYEVVGTTDGREGVGLVRQLKPGLILCDVMMPNYDGFAVLETIRSDPDTASIPFVFVSAKTDPATVQKSVEMGADGYLFKPFEYEELMAVVHTHLG